MARFAFDVKLPYCCPFSVILSAIQVILTLYGMQWHGERVLQCIFLSVLSVGEELCLNFPTHTVYSVLYSTAERTQLCIGEKHEQRKSRNINQKLAKT